MRRRSKASRGVSVPSAGDREVSYYREERRVAGLRTAGMGGLLGKLLVRAGAVTPGQAGEIRKLAARTLAEVTDGAGVVYDDAGHEVKP
jgi:hypothetical protein